MSESIARLKFETENLQSLKEARNEMYLMYQNALKCDTGVTMASKSEVEFAKSLGDMKTSARGVQGQIRELTTSYIDFSSIYNKMSAEEKASPFGQAMAKSLEDLKNRTIESKEEFKQINGEIGNSQSPITNLKDAFNDLTGKLGLNITKLGAFGSAIGIAKESIEIAKDALMQNQQVMADWGKITASSESLYRGFLSAINNGDISGFISNMNIIVEKATEAFSAMAQLKKESLYNAAPVANLESEINRDRFMLRYHKFVEKADGSKNSMGLKNGDTLNSQQEANLRRQLLSNTRKLANLSKESYSVTGNAISALQSRKAAENGININDYKQGTSSFAALKQRESGASEYLKWNRSYYAKMIKNSGGSGVMPDQSEIDKMNPFRRYKNWVAMLKSDETEKQISELQSSQQQSASKYYSTMGSAFRAINSSEKHNKIKVNSPGTETPNDISREKLLSQKDNEPLIGSYDDLAKGLSILQKQWRAVADDDSRKRIQNQMDGIQETMDAMKAKPIEIPIVPDYSAMTTSNIDTVISSLKQKLQTADIGSDVWNQTKKNISQAEQFQQLITTATENGVDTNKSTTNFWNGSSFSDNISKFSNANPQEGDFGSTWKDIAEGKNIDTSQWQTIVDDINEKLSTIGNGITLNLDPVTQQIQKVGKVTKQTNEDGKDIGKTITSVAQLGAAFSNIGGDGKAAAMGQIAVAIAQMIAAFTGSLSKTSGPWEMIAAVAAGMTTIVSAAAAFTSAGNFSNGGIIGGNYPTGDNLTANVNSGELILNTAQQNAVASELSNNSRFSPQQQTQQSQPYLTGETIWLGVNNHLRRTGRGEIVTTRG